MLGCWSFRQIRASRSSFWKSIVRKISFQITWIQISDNVSFTSRCQFLCVDYFCSKFKSCWFLNTSFHYWKCTSVKRWRNICDVIKKAFPLSKVSTEKCFECFSKLRDLNSSFGNFYKAGVGVMIMRRNFLLMIKSCQILTFLTLL